MYSLSKEQLVDLSDRVSNVVYAQTGSKSIRDSAVTVLNDFINTECLDKTKGLTGSKKGSI